MSQTPKKQNKTKPYTTISKYEKMLGLEKLVSRNEYKKYILINEWFWEILVNQKPQNSDALIIMILKHFRYNFGSLSGT
jgi:hypothetical protein